LKSSFPRIVCLIPTLPTDLHPDCVKSVLSQTVPVSLIVMAYRRLVGGTTATKVSFILNDMLSHVCVDDFDYVLRVDCDTVLKPEFLSVALRGDPDVYGENGYAMLIKVSTFKRFMDARFNFVSDDQYTFNKIKVEGGRAVQIDNSFIETRPQKHDTATHLFCGEVYYRMGYEPIHILDFLRRPCTRHTTRKFIRELVLGYFIAMIRRVEKFDIAPRIWSYQVRRLIHL
jgi:hypothetical protein